MLDRIKRPFRQVDAGTNTVTYFDANSLAEYIESTGDVRHPLTRVPLTETELRRLQHASGLNLTDAIETRQTERRERIEADTLRDFLEGDVSSVVQAIADEASDVEGDSGSALARCRIRHAGRFDEALANLYASVPDRVDAVCDQAVETLVGDRRIVHDVVVAWASTHVRDARERVRMPRIVRRMRDAIDIPAMDLSSLTMANTHSPRSVPEVIRNLLSMASPRGALSQIQPSLPLGDREGPISIHFGQRRRRMQFTRP
jgi:hypothetical protein